MKIACLSYFVPRKENVKGPSGLLYQTLRLRPESVHLTVFLFSQEDESFLDVPEVMDLSAGGVKFVRCPARVAGGVQAPFFWPRGARNIARHEMPALSGFDRVWAYPYWFAPFLRSVGKPVLISGMDSATLLYWRKLRAAPWRHPGTWLRTAAGLVANFLFEAAYLRGRDVHVVGAGDARVLRWMTVRPKFTPHPFLAYPPSPREARPLDRPLTFLLSNAGDHIYGSPRYLGWIRTLAAETTNEPAIRLVLHKASPSALSAIANIAADHPQLIVDNVTWVDDYAAMLCKVDIQLFPLDVGAGTKTSVLTALHYGVRVLCTPIAAENVEANPYLLKVPSTREGFQQALHKAIAAVRGSSNAVDLRASLTQHSPEACVAAFWKHLEPHAE